MTSGAFPASLTTPPRLHRLSVGIGVSPRASRGRPRGTSKTPLHLDPLRGPFASPGPRQLRLNRGDCAAPCSAEKTPIPSREQPCGLRKPAALGVPSLCSPGATPPASGPAGRSLPVFTHLRVSHNAHFQTQRKKHAPSFALPGAVCLAVCGRVFAFGYLETVLCFPPNARPSVGPALPLGAAALPGRPLGLLPREPGPQRVLLFRAAPRPACVPCVGVSDLSVTTVGEWFVPLLLSASGFRSWSSLLSQSQEDI